MVNSSVSADIVLGTSQSSEPTSANIFRSSDKMALDTTINDMDIDMDFDEAEDAEITRLRAEAAEIDAVWIHPVNSRDGCGN